MFGRARESCPLVSFPPIPIPSSQVVKPPSFCGSWAADLHRGSGLSPEVRREAELCRTCRLCLLFHFVF